MTNRFAIYSLGGESSRMIVAAIGFFATCAIPVASVAAQQIQETNYNTTEIQTIDDDGNDGSVTDGKEAPDPSDEAEDQPSLQEPQPRLQEIEEPERHKAVIFNVLQESDPAILNLIREALQAQLSDVDVDLVFNGGINESSELRNLIEKGKAMAQPHDAAGVFWLDANHGENWLLYLVDPEGERVLVRRAGAGLESLTATVEAVAVITRSSSKALIEGRTIGLRSSSANIDDRVDSWTELRFQMKSEQDLRSETEQSRRKEAIKHIASYEHSDSGEKGAQRESKRARFRFAAAYRGTTFAQQDPWHSGIGLWAGWISEINIYIGLGYVLTPDTNVTDKLIIDIDNTSVEIPVEFWIERAPFELFSGYQYRTGLFALEGEMGMVLDSVSRRVESPPEEQASLVDETPDRSGITFGLFLRGRIEYFFERYTAIFAGLGLEYFLRNFDYVADLEKRERLLEPYPVRFNLEVGLAFHL